MVCASGEYRVSYRRNSVCMITVIHIMSLLLLQHCHSRSQTMMRMIAVDTVVYGETDAYAILDIRTVVDLHDKEIIIGQDDNFLVVRSSRSGEILSALEIPLDATDSVFCPVKDSVIADSGRWTLDGKQWYAGSRHCFSLAEQRELLTGRINSAAFINDSIVVAHASIAGPIKIDRSTNFAIGHTRAVLFIDLSRSAVFRIVKVPLWHQHYVVTSSHVNPVGTAILEGIVDYYWLRNRSNYTQPTLCKFTIANKAKRMFAERDSGAGGSWYDGMVVDWKDSATYVYANAAEDCVYDETDIARYRLPQAESGSNDRLRYILGIHQRDEMVGVYCLEKAGRKKHFTYYIFQNGNPECVQSIALSNDPNTELLYARLIDRNHIRVYYKSEKVYGVTSALERLR